MRTRTRNPFTTITTAGLLLPVDLLVRIADGDPGLKGLDAKKDYHLRSERITEASSKAWNECQAAWKSFRRKYQALPTSDTGTTVTRDEWLLPLFEELGYGRLQVKTKHVIDDKEYPLSHGWENHVPIHLISARYPLDRRSPGVAGAATRSPYSMVQELLNRSPLHRWGFVSNGLKLFLLCDNFSLARAANVEFDLEAMMEGDVYADFQLLFLLCHQSRVELLDAERKPAAKEKKATKAKGKKQAKLVEEESDVGGEGAEFEEILTESTPTQECWLDRWSKQAEQTGVQAREKLRYGVENAIQALGAGFLEARGNKDLRDRLRTGTLSKEDYYRQLLRLVYRLILTLVAEEKKTEDGSNLLHPPATTSEARERYARFYSVGRLRSLAQSRRGTAHPDLYESLKVLFDKLRTGHLSLGIPALGSFLFSPTSTPDLDSVRLSNEALLNCIRSLCITKDESARSGGMDRPVDFGNLGAEELGSVYESLLELHPLIDTDAGPFTLSTAAGNERKTTGSYYTPTSLINCLLDSALDPVVREAIDKRDRNEAAKALLNLKVCDPACGSGHFLIAAAERMAKQLARLQTDDDEPTTLAIQKAKREIIGRCIYGVDINPMAVELCKVSLWMEAMEPGKPLSFLDHHVLCGNSLLGTIPVLLKNGIPDDAFTAIEGDIKTCVADLKKRNKQERKDFAAGQSYLFDTNAKHETIAADFARLNIAPDGTLDEVSARSTEYQRLVRSSEYESTRLLADTWCAVFVWRKDESDLGKMCPTERDFRKVESDTAGMLPHVRAEVERLRDQYQFFHWYLAFPDVFHLPGKNETPENGQTGWSGGFDVMLGNPPWGQIQLDPREYFAERAPEIVNTRNMAARDRAIAKIVDSDPRLFSNFVEAARTNEATQAFLHNSNCFPLGSVGRLNSAPLFCELSFSLQGPTGRVGIIVPTGIATDSFTQHLFRKFVTSQRLVSLFDFENRLRIFSEVAPVQKFCLLTLCGSQSALQTDEARFAFFLISTDDLSDPERLFSLKTADFQLLNPNTMNCPIFRSRREAELTKRLYRNAPILRRTGGDHDESPWGFGGILMFMMNSGSEIFRSYGELVERSGELSGGVFATPHGQFLPLIEGKFIQQFNHRHGGYDADGGEEMFRARAGTVSAGLEDKNDPHFVVVPRYWVHHSHIDQRLDGKWAHRWLICFRDIVRPATDSRCAVFAVVPRYAAGDTAPIATVQSPIAMIPSFIACMNSFVVDYAARSSIGGTHLRFSTLYQIPVLGPSTFEAEPVWMACRIADWISSRVLELTYTAWDLEPFARECGYAGPPFRWDEERRFRLRAELDAAFFHLYLPADPQGNWLPNPSSSGHAETPEDLARLKASFPTPRHAVEYIMETFPIVKRKDIAKYGDYRTKLLILDVYDRMQKAMTTGELSETLLDPPAADPRVAHPRHPIGILAFGSLLNDPGDEIEPRIVMRLPTQTPFAVEFGRYSKKRGGGATVIQHNNGTAVSAEILALDPSITLEEAQNILYRRERGDVGSDVTYTRGTGKNDILIEHWNDDPRVQTVLYTDFNPEGKIPHPSADELATKAIESVAKANPGNDAISYLMSCIESGVQTPLTLAYRDAILQKTGTTSLAKALASVQNKVQTENQSQPRVH